MSKPDVSIILATKNEGKNIGRLVESIREQNEVNYEIILVDNSDNSKTVDAAKFSGLKKVFRLKGSDKFKNFRGAQLNEGVKRAKGDIVFFPDADMTFKKGLFKEIVEKMGNHDALFIPEIIVGDSWFIKVRNFERSFYNQTPVDGIRVVKTPLYKKVGGFDVENIVFGPDDWDFTKTIKNATDKIGITENNVFHHEGWMKWSDFIKKKKKYNLSFEDYINKWGKDDEEVVKQLGLKYRAFGVFVEDGKWKRLILNPHLAVGMYGLRFLTWLNYKLG